MEITVLPYFIKTIDLAELRLMQDVLSRSAGYAVTLSEELEYFQTKSPNTWRVAKNGDRHVGLIRAFPQSDGTWSSVELYVDPDCERRREIASELLSQFKMQTRLPPGQRLRFDILRDDVTLNSLIVDHGLSERRQLFRHFEMDLNGLSEHAPQDLHDNHQEPIDELVETLCGLHPVTAREVESWLRDQSLRWLSVDGRVTCVLQLFENSDSAQINRLATHPSYLRQGHAETLVLKTAKEVAGKSIPRLQLKVEDNKNPAIELYKKCGFKEIGDKAQYWHSSWS